ncbi:MAG: hypothetical protein KAU95_04665 [Candidatus Aenigmarchaeota archaeon]|nr:hypothetical protein [Candidatus Aenigmarchaeota archaeon]
MLVKSPLAPKRLIHAIADMYGGIRRGRKEAILKNDLHGISVHSNRKARGTPISIDTIAAPAAKIIVLVNIVISLGS